MGRHAARLRRNFPRRDLVPMPDCLIGSSRSPRTCSYNDYLSQNLPFKRDDERRNVKDGPYYSRQVYIYLVEIKPWGPEIDAMVKWSEYSPWR